MRYELSEFEWATIKSFAEQDSQHRSQEGVAVKPGKTSAIARYNKGQTATDLMLDLKIARQAVL
jgi:hypothetical protein